MNTPQKLKIHWMSNAPWSGTGYGNQTNLFVPRLQRAGYGMSMTAFYGLDGHILNWRDGIDIYPKAFDPYGQDIMSANTITTKSDIVITLFDAWVSKPDEYDPSTKWIAWYPIDSEPVTKINIDKVRKAYKRLVFSKHGCKMMDATGLDYDYIPHGVDTKIFKPIDRIEARKLMELPQDAFIVGMVAANKGFPPRKAFAENIAAFRMFKEKHTDAILYLHTSDGSRGEGFDIRQYLDLLGLKIGTDVILADQYNYVLSYPDNLMNALYNSFDVHLLCSKGEGFGIPILEAQAAGCPVIVGDWTAMGELCFSGWKLDKYTEANPEFTQYGAFWYVPVIGAIYERLEKAYEVKGNMEYRDRARKGAMAYDAEKIVEKYWIPYLDKLQVELEAEKNKPIHKHEWAKIGVYDKQGNVCVPCATCNDELKNNIVFKDGFKDKLGLELVEDNDPIVKIIKREIEQDYQIDNLDLKAGDVVLDVGAHKGIVSSYLVKKYPGIVLHAFEPVLENWKTAAVNINSNTKDDYGLYNVAVTSDARPVNIYANPNNSGSGEIGEHDPSLGVQVESINLDEFCKDMDRIALLKIDCEGSEYEILSNRGGLLEKIDRIRGEFHGSLEQIDKLLEYVQQFCNDVHITKLVTK